MEISTWNIYLPNLNSNTNYNVVLPQSIIDQKPNWVRVQQWSNRFGSSSNTAYQISEISSSLPSRVTPITDLQGFVPTLAASGQVRYTSWLVYDVTLNSNPTIWFSLNPDMLTSYITLNVRGVGGGGAGPGIVGYLTLSFCNSAEYPKID